MLFLQNLSYAHPDKNLLFENVSLAVNAFEKIALIGNNGSGKSTLLKIIAKELQPLEGLLHVSPELFYVPQLFGQYDHLSVKKALKIDGKLKALDEILKGKMTEENYAMLADDWTIEERCQAALKHWQLTDLDLSQKMETLSGGQKTKVFLAGISIHQPDLVLLDEPSNHLDFSGREILYEFIRSAECTIVTVSHDRKLLNLLDRVAELSKRGITTYGGNYDFYTEQKQLANNALNQDLLIKEKALRKAREKERETMERQQKADSRGKGKQEKAGIARIMMNTLRNNAEKSTSKIKGVHAEKIDGISQELQELRAALPDIDKIKFGFDNSRLHNGKILFKADEINFSYGDHPLWKKDLNFQITSGERYALKGTNGSGKTSLIKIVLGKLKPQTGTVLLAHHEAVYIDQDYSLISNHLKIYEQSQKFNTRALQEHDIKIRLSRFLFTKDDWNKPCSALSGGEKMRLMLCCLTISSQSPDLIILDEPTNNLDIQNIEILTSAMNEYRGTVIVVSHDDFFLEQIKTSQIIQL